MYKWSQFRNEINFDGLITNLENTELLFTTNFGKTIKNIDLNVSNDYNKIIIFKNDYKKYNYTSKDTIFVKINVKLITNKINKLHKSNNVFLLNYVINNMIILKRMKPCFCIDCKRIHENQHPYVFVINNNIFFHCRRSPKPINISNIINEV